MIYEYKISSQSFIRSPFFFFDFNTLVIHWWMKITAKSGQDAPELKYN